MHIKQENIVSVVDMMTVMNKLKVNLNMHVK